VLFLDEPLESLDDAAAERAIELCQHFAADVENTFIIAHNPAIKDLVSSRVVVEKRGGLATLAA
jgi:ABC-type multidrug transport system ATPase subunit